MPLGVRREPVPHVRQTWNLAQPIRVDPAEDVVHQKLRAQVQPRVGVPVRDVPQALLDFVVREVLDNLLPELALPPSLDRLGDLY